MMDAGLRVLEYQISFFFFQTCQCPPGAFSQLEPSGDHPATKQSLETARSTTLPRQMHSKKAIQQPRGSVDGGRMHTQSHDESRTKLTAIVQRQMADEQLQIRINNIQNTTALAAMRFTANPQAIGEHDPGIIDGFLENVSLI